MLAEIIRELKKCEENVTIHSENVPNWAKIVEAQRPQTAVISSLHKAKTLTKLYKKMPDTQTKDPEQINLALVEDVNTAYKNTNWDITWFMARYVTNVASSTILKTYKEVPGWMWSTPLRRKVCMNKTLASKWKIWIQLTLITITPQ